MKHKLGLAIGIMVLTLGPVWNTAWSAPPTDTDTPVYTATFTETPTESATFTPTETATYTSTPAETPTESLTFTPNVTETTTSAPTESATITPTDILTLTPNLSATLTPNDTRTSTPTTSATATVTPTFTITATFSPTPIVTRTPTPTGTETLSPVQGPLAHVQTNRKTFAPGASYQQQWTVSFESDLKPDEIKAAIYNLNGRLIKTLVLQRSGSNYSAQWDGHDQQDQVAAPGAYLYLISAGQEHYRGALVVVR